MTHKFFAATPSIIDTGNSKRNFVIEFDTIEQLFVSEYFRKFEAMITFVDFVHEEELTHNQTIFVKLVNRNDGEATNYAIGYLEVEPEIP